MKRKKIILTALFVNFLCFLNYTSLLIGAGKFDFNDGTTQGWTLDQMYVTSDQTKFTPVIGYTLMNSNNELLAYTGSLLIGRSDQNDIYLESPDLSSNSNWQGISGISVDVRRLLYSPGWGDFPNIFFVQLQLKVIDTADNNKEKIFGEYDGSNFIFHDITTFDQLYQITWQPSWLTDPRYKVKKIRIRITGPGDVAQELWYRGSWNIDNVSAIGGSATNNTNPGTNVQINLGSGVNVTFDTVTGAGNTSLTTLSSGTPPPGGFAILPIGSPTYYSITTTATFSGNIKIGIQYNDAGLTSQQEAALKLQVYEQPPGQWKNITTSVDINANIIYGVVTHLSEFAIMFSSGGASEQWVLTNQPTNGTINCFTVTGVGLFAGTEAGGVFVSSNNGGNWNPANTGLTNLTVRALCANNAYTFAGTWGEGVFRTYNDGISWTPVNTGLSNLYVSSLYSSGSNLIAGTWGGIFLSTNNGDSWTAINTGLTETHIRSLLIKWGNFFTGTINGLFYSLNNGANWTAMNTGLTNTAAISLASMPESSAEELFTGTDGGGVFVRTPNTNWTAINSGLSNLHIPYLCFGSSNLFAATWGGGVFVTQDPAAGWTAINDGLTNLYIRTLIVSGTNIFAGTNDGGIWRRTLSDLISEVPDIASDPTSWNFGSIMVGNNSDKTFVIKNEGTADLNVMGSTLTGANALEFSIQTNGGSFTLAPGAAQEIKIKFAPTGAGSKSASLSISSNDLDENPFLVSLSGAGTVATTPDISSNPTSWNYGAINVGNYSDKTFVIKNDGTAQLNVAATYLIGAQSAEFSIQSGGDTFSLMPGATRDVVIRFAPTSLGDKTALLRISSNDPDENPLDIALTGNGIATAPDISSTPNSWSYGTINVGTNSDKTFVIKNDGNANLNVTATSVTGANATEFNIQSGGGAFTLAPAGTRDIMVRFSPTSAGSKNASLSISSNDPDENPFVVSLSGTGSVVTTPDISSNPTSWDYGSVAVGNNSDKTFVIKNEGTADLSVTGTTLTGTNALEFSIQTGGGSFTLAPAATRNIMIKFAPTGAGSKSANLSISSNDPDENPFVVSLSGTGSVVTTPDISSNPATWNYGAINVGTNSDKTFVIKNDGTANLNVTATSLTGTNAAEFSIPSGGGAFTLAPAGTRDIMVRFSPSSAGSKSANLSISSNDPDENPFVVALSGSGAAVATVPINPVTASPQMAGIEFWVSIDVGTNTNPVTDLFGVSFNLNYTNTTYINYVTAEAGSFMGSDVIFFPTPDDANGKVSIGISRKTPQSGVNGFGTVARVKLIADLSTPNNTPLQLSISNVMANNSTGAVIALAPGSLNITIQAGLIVWPGDTNNNGTADQADVLPLGLHWGKTGPARQNASMAWSGQLAMFWTPQAATYADANGDGTVNQADVLPIGLNWNKTHTQSLVVVESTPIPFSKRQTAAKLTIVVSGSTQPDQNFYIDIFANEVSDLFGLSFEMIYTPALIIDPQVAEAGPNNLLGSDVIYFPFINKTSGVDTGKVSVGITRKYGQGGVSGSGLVTRITAHMSATAVNHQSKTMLVLANIQANDAMGNTIPIDTSAHELFTAIEMNPKNIPTAISLQQNYPNPFNMETTIPYQLPYEADVQLSIYDMQGHEVRRLVSGINSASSHNIEWDGRNEVGQTVASGMYFYRIEIKASENAQPLFVAVKKIILMK